MFCSIFVQNPHSTDTRRHLLDCKYVGTKNISIVSYHKYLAAQWNCDCEGAVDGRLLLLEIGRMA